MRKSFALLAILASAGLATDAVSHPAMRQPLPAELQQGPDALVMLVGARGSISPQRAGTAVVVKPPHLLPCPSPCRILGAKPYRPTVGNPPGDGSKPEIRDHRTGSHNPQSKGGGGCPAGWAYGPN